jgi:large subunit ribosomal protein L17
MRKRVFGRNLGRSYTSKKALFRSLTRAIVINGEIQTTYAKAKAVSGFVEKLIRVAKKGDVSARRRVYRELANDRESADEIFEIAKNFKTITGGYLKVVNLPPRKGDMARTVKISWSKMPESVKKGSKVGESGKGVKKTNKADYAKSEEKSAKPNKKTD